MRLDGGGCLVVCRMVSGRLVLGGGILGGLFRLSFPRFDHLVSVVVVVVEVVEEESLIDS